MRAADLLPLLVATAWVIGSGALVATALGARERIVVLGAAAPIGIGALTGTVSLLALARIPARPVTLAAGLLVLCAGAALLRRGHPPAAVAVAESGRAGPPGDGWLGRIGGLLTVTAGCLAVWTWWHGIGPLSTYNQDHDPIHHQVIVAWMQRSGRAAPWQVIPVDVTADGPVHFYPSGMHLVAALTGGTVGGPIVGLNAVLVVFGGIAWVLGTGALTAAVLREHGLSAGWQRAASGSAALAAAGLYRPGLQLVRDNGVMANAVAMLLVPGTVAALLVARRWRSAGTGCAGLACAGALAVHPVAIPAVGVTTAAVLLGGLAVPAVRASIRPRLAALAGAAVVAAVAAAPVLLGAVAAGAVTTSVPPDTVGVPVRESLPRVSALAIGGFADPSGASRQIAIAVLALLGVGVCLWRRWAPGLVLAAALWLAVSVNAYWSPTQGLSAPIAGFYYNSAARIQTNVATVVPSLAGIGLVGLAVGTVVVAARLRLPVSARAVPVLLLALGLGFGLGPVRGYAIGNADRLADRYAGEPFHRVTVDDERAARWLAGHVGPGERVFNSANDGSTYAYVRYGVAVVNIFSLGAEEAPYTYELLARLNQVDRDAGLRRLVLDQHIAYVYDDAAAPRIGSVYSPGGWVTTTSYDVAPGLRNLAGVPELSVAFESGTVRIWRVDRSMLSRTAP